HKVEYPNNPHDKLELHYPKVADGCKSNLPKQVRPHHWYKLYFRHNHVSRYCSLAHLQIPHWSDQFHWNLNNFQLQPDSSWQSTLYIPQLPLQRFVFEYPDIQTTSLVLN